MKDIKFNKTPAIVRDLDLHSPLAVSEGAVLPRDCTIVLARCLDHTGKRHFCHLGDDRLGHLYEGDVLPVALGLRRALQHNSGNVPAEVRPGTVLTLLNRVGIVGIPCGLDASYGEPVELMVLGTAVRADGHLLNLTDGVSALPNMNDEGYVPRSPNVAPLRDDSIPIVAIVGTAMSFGKTTVGCTLVHSLRTRGRTVAAVKLTGIADMADLRELGDAGAVPVRSFQHRGLVAT